VLKNVPNHQPDNFIRGFSQIRAAFNGFPNINDHIYIFITTLWWSWTQSSIRKCVCSYWFASPRVSGNIMDIQQMFFPQVRVKKKFGTIHFFDPNFVGHTSTSLRFPMVFPWDFSKKISFTVPPQQIVPPGHPSAWHRPRPGPETPQKNVTPGTPVLVNCHITMENHHF